MSTDTEWEKWGIKDPYFGVITDEKFRNKNLNEEALQEFFESGREHINNVLSVCKHQFDSDFAPKRVLDFGCGTGRLVIPFAEIADHVVGIDVSKSMLIETQKNCERYSRDNVTLHLADDTLSALTETFDLIHSVIVFQHIPPARGKTIFQQLLHHIDDGGIGVIQITYSKAIYSTSGGLLLSEAPPPPPEPLLVRVAQYLKYQSLRLMNQGGTEASDPDQADPEMQMNTYRLNELFFMLQSIGVQNIYTQFTDHGGELGVYLYFQKPSKSS